MCDTHLHPLAQKWKTFHELDNFARGAVRNCCVSIQCTRGTRKSQSRGRKRWRRWQESEALRKEEWARAPERWERERCIMRKWRKGNEESGLRLASKGPTRFSAGAINGDFYLRWLSENERPITKGNGKNEWGKVSQPCKMVIEKRRPEFYYCFCSEETQTTSGVWAGSVTTLLQSWSSS